MWQFMLAARMLARARFGALLLLALLWLCTPLLVRAAELRTVRFVYDWPVPDFGMVPIVVGQKMGFYQQHGLSVEALFPPNAQTTARMLASGRADIGFEGATDLVFAANQGIPIIAIGNFSRSNSWCLIGRPGEPIDMAQLKGKSIGIFTDSWTRAMMAFVLKKANLRENEIQEITADNDDIPLLLAKKIDLATNSAGWGVAKIVEQLHQQPTLACNEQIGVPNIPVWVLTAAKAWLAQNAAVAQAWLAATSDAIAWSIAHPAQAAQLFTQAYPAAGSLNYNTLGWSYTTRFMSGPDGYFKQNDGQWNLLAGALKDTGQIGATQPAASYYSNAYLSP